MATRFLYTHPSDNIAGNAGLTAETGSEDITYPLTNATDFTFANLANPAKFVETTGAIQGDFTSARRMDGVLIWHNLDEGTPIKFQANASAAWGSPTLDYSTTAPARRSDDYTRKLFIDLRNVSGYSTGGFRYFRIFGGPNGDPFGLKFMIFSGLRQFTRDIMMGTLEDDESQTNILQETDARFPWAYDLGSAPRTFRGKVQWTVDDAEQCREWFRACGGRVGLTTVCLYPDTLPAEGLLLRWAPGTGVGLGKPVHTTTKDEVTYSSQLAFDEVTAGDPEWY